MSRLSSVYVSLMMLLALGTAWGQAVNQITVINPSSAAQGASNLLVTFTLDTDSPPAPPADVAPQSVTLGGLSGSSVTHASQYAVTAVFAIPAGEAVGPKDAVITFSTPNGALTFSAAGGFTVTAGVAAPEVQLLDGGADIPDGTGSVNFGGTPVGTAISKTFTVKNVGTTSLALTAPITVPSGFTVTASFGSATLAAGASTTFTVRLNAVAAGSYGGTLSFGTNDADENPFNITLAGTVVAPGTRTYPIVDTGQTTCYNATTQISAPAAGQAFYGQDAQVAGNQPAYTVSGDGLTVYDQVTGLTWQRSPDTTGDGTINAADKLTWTQAQARPAALNTAHYGGYSDWRLPTIKELYALIKFNGTDPSGISGTDTSGLTPFIDAAFRFAYGDTSAGERIIDAQYASSTLYVGGTQLLFGVNFADGRIKGYGLTMPGGGTKTFFVQCVRGNTSYGINQFVNNSDQTITDQATGLMWAKADSGTGMSWQDALAWAQAKNAATYLGHNDWRLPNAKELQSIVDYTRAAAIDPLFSVTAITGENGQADAPWYWSSTTHAASNGSGAAAAYLAFGKGWGYLDSAWVDIHGAGCQRSDPKGGSLSSYTYVPYGYYNGIAPQGDAIRLCNYVRLVRDAGSPAAHAYQPDALLRTSTESSYTGNNVYNTTGTGQSKTLSTLANTAVSVVYKVQNDGDASDILTVMGTAGGSGWTVRYYTAAGEITSQVTGAGWNTGSLAAGAFVTLWASVTPAATVAAGSVKTLLLTAVSAADAAKTDVVAAAVTAATTYRPDLLLRTSAESSYTGNGIYNTTGSGQAKAQTVAAGKTATYVFSLQNDGNATDSYALTTPAAVSGWTVRYYAAGQGEITAQITGAGWTTPSLARGAAQGLWVTVTPASTVASGAACSILLTAVSTGDAAKKDAVSVVTTKQ